MAQKDELRSFIRHGSEERNLEYKQSMDWGDPATRAKITKGVLAMANIRDGGVIVVGVEDGTWTPVGLPPAMRDSLNQDQVMAHVAEFADPNVELTVSHVKDDTGQDYEDFVVIQVRQFEGTPGDMQEGHRLRERPSGRHPDADPSDVRERPGPRSS